MIRTEVDILHEKNRSRSSTEISLVSSNTSQSTKHAPSEEILCMLNAGSVIPPAVPSVFHFNTREQVFIDANTRRSSNVTNVYIRGLPPAIDDEQLYQICIRFGEITSSKAIIDERTGICKGFGFACFRQAESAQACIQGLLQYGYQASLAKESFSSRLKELQDPESTNVYLSNLPLYFEEKVSRQDCFMKLTSGPRSSTRAS